MDLPDTLSQDDLELLARVSEGESDLLADALGLERLKARGLVTVSTVTNALTGEPAFGPFAHPTADGYEALGMAVQRLRVRRAS